MNRAMRIIAGTAGRLKIRVPKGVVRPSTDFVRQAMFSILGEVVVGAKALDLFAGSGAIGLEALSRGAASCQFVDESRHSVVAIEANLKAARLEGGRAVKADATAWLARERGSYDLVFADPPYARAGEPDFITAMLSGPDLRRVVAEAGWFVAEGPAEQDAPVAEGWELRDRRTYSGTAILLYAPKPAG